MKMLGQILCINHPPLNVGYGSHNADKKKLIPICKSTAVNSHDNANKYLNVMCITPKSPMLDLTLSECNTANTECVTNS